MACLTQDLSVCGWSFFFSLDGQEIRLGMSFFVVLMVWCVSKVLITVLVLFGSTA
jgi:hypothetical protein